MHCSLEKDFKTEGCVACGGRTDMKNAQNTFFVECGGGAQAGPGRAVCWFPMWL
jgi:hypothetical protein